MKLILTSLRATLVLAVVTCGIYPLLVTLIAQTAFQKQAHGSLITGQDGTLIGSELLAQSFTSERYFHPRPSAAGAGYDAASSSGSNLGPTSQKLHDAVQERIATYRSQNSLAADAQVPSDAVTASASGLDPHISMQNAMMQAARVARARNLDVEKVKALIAESTETSFFGPAGVHVLKLNLALDAK